MTARPAGDALGVNEQVMAVPNEMIRMAAITGRVGTWRVVVVVVVCGAE